MMIMVGHLLVISFLALLSGCALVTGQCYPPSQLPIYPSSYATTASKCKYFLTVTDFNKDEGWVKGKYPKDLITEHKANSKKEFTFLVRHLDWWVDKKQLVVGKDYIFMGDPDSPFLQPFFVQDDYEEENKSKGHKTTP